MRLKKTLLLGAALSLINLPMMAHANLKTHNGTDADSTVMIDALGKCMGPNYITPAGGDSDYPGVLVNSLCNHVNPCVAHIYMDNSCQTAAIAIATFDLPSQTITNIQPLDFSKYTAAVDPADGSKVILTKS